MEEDDVDMLLVAEGDSLAFERIVNRRKDELTGFFERRAPGDGDDLSQEVFIRVWSKADTYISGSFRSWMFRIARNLLIDRQRRSVTSPQPMCFGAPKDDELSAVDMAEDPFSDPAMVAEHRDNLRFVHEAMQGIDPSQADVLETYAEGWLIPEIAEMCSVPPRTAQSRLRLARTKVIRRMFDMQLTRIAKAAFAY